VIEHALEHPRVPMLWHHLEAVGEVPIITIRAGIDSVQIDRDGNESPFDTGQDAMLIGTPLGELGEVLDDLGRIGMEDVWTIPMDENPRVIKRIKRIAGDMRPPVDEQDASTIFAGEALGQHAAGESRANDQEVEHRRLRP
jgi:hypothetical protein